MGTLEKTEEPRVDKTKEDQFTFFVNQYLDGIYNFAKYMVSDREEANDISQKTFLSLYQNFSKLDLTVSPRPWLFKVARNHCLDYIKKKKPLPFSEIEDQIFDIPENLPSVESRVDDVIFIQKFKINVEQLPSAEKEVLLLKYFEDLTFEQIAEVQGASVNTVKSHFYRGKNKLYNFLKE